MSLQRKLKLKKALLFNALLACAAAVVVLSASRIEFLKRMELFSSDICFRLKNPVPSESPIVMIEITDQDVAKIGRWPWNRSWHAAMAKVLSDLGARVVYFDVIFSEPSSEEEDALFEESLKTTKKVYLPYVFRERPFDVKKTLMPIERFSSHVKGTGAMNVYPDKDGTIRKIPILFVGESGTYPHVTLKMAMDYRGLEIGKITPDYLLLTGEQKEVKVPLIEDNSLIINWEGRWTESFKHYSFIDVLAGYQDYLQNKPPGVRLEDFKDAVCLVGITGFGLYDIKPVPLEPEYPGIGIIANTLDTLLESNFIHVLPGWVNAVLLFLLALIPSILIFGENPFRETIMVLLIAVAYFLSAFLLFTKNIKVNIFLPILGLFVSYIIVGTHNFVRTTVEKKSLFDISITDGLTGLCNISYFKTLLESEITMARSGMSKEFVLVLCDIDHFKHFNDTYGHPVGDMILKETANTLKGAIRGSDVVARYGGEEMMILLKNISLGTGLEVVEKIRKSVDEGQYSDEKNTYSITMSFGVASYLAGDTVDTIIKRTDEGLYKGKKDGRNCVRTVQKQDYFTPE